MAVVTEAELRAALEPELTKFGGWVSQRSVADAIVGVDESSMSSWINNAQAQDRPQFSDTVRRRVSKGVLKWLQQKKGMFTGRELAGAAADDDDDNAADDEEEEYEVSEGLRLQRSKSNATATRTSTRRRAASSRRRCARVPHVNLGSHGTAREAAAVARHRDVNLGSRRTARAAAEPAPAAEAAPTPAPESKSPAQERRELKLVAREEMEAMESELARRARRPRRWRPRSGGWRR